MHDYEAHITIRTTDGYVQHLTVRVARFDVFRDAVARIANEAAIEHDVSSVRVYMRHVPPALRDLITERLLPWTIEASFAES